MNDWKLIAGSLSDREVAERFNISATAVRRYRHARGIPAFDPHCAALPPELSERLATTTNYKLSKEFRVSLARIRAARTELGIPEPGIVRERFIPLENIWSDEAVSLLGAMPDTEVADRLGVSNFPVKRKRAELGIKAYKRTVPEITPEIASEFGKVPDAELARRLGVSTTLIRRARLKLRQ